MKYLDPYNNKDEVFENINKLIVDYQDLIQEGRFSEWLLVAPKIRRLQEKANQLRIRCARAEAAQRRQIDYATARGSKVDVARMWELLQQKIDAWEDTAREYENQAEELSSGSVYLQKVRTLTRLKGVLKVNKEKIAVAEGEERRELMKTRVALTKHVQTLERTISDKTEAEKLRLDLIKQKEDAKKLIVPPKIDSKANYFDTKKAAALRSPDTSKTSEPIVPDL